MCFLDDSLGGGKRASQVLQADIPSVASLLLIPPFVLRLQLGAELHSTVFRTVFKRFTDPALTHFRNGENARPKKFSHKHNNV